MRSSRYHQWPKLSSKGDLMAVATALRKGAGAFEKMDVVGNNARWLKYVCILIGSSAEVPLSVQIQSHLPLEPLPQSSGRRAETPRIHWGLRLCHLCFPPGQALSLHAVIWGTAPAEALNFWWCDLCLVDLCICWDALLASTLRSWECSMMYFYLGNSKVQQWVMHVLQHLLEHKSILKSAVCLLIAHVCHDYWFKLTVFLPDAWISEHWLRIQSWMSSSVYKVCRSCMWPNNCWSSPLHGLEEFAA